MRTTILMEWLKQEKPAYLKNFQEEQKSVRNKPKGFDQAKELNRLRIVYLQNQLNPKDIDVFLEALLNYISSTKKDMGINPMFKGFVTEAVSYTHLTLPTIYSV